MCAARGGHHGSSLDHGAGDRSSLLGNNGDDGDAHDARARTRKDGDSDTTSGRIVSPFDVYEKLSSCFGSEAWALKQQANEKPISRMTVQWVGPGDIKRPRREKQFEAIGDINATYQCMVIKADQVATRQHSCWCTGCIHQAQVGADNAFLNADFLVSDCKRKDSAGYDWCGPKGCEQLGPGGAEVLRKTEGAAGNRLASKLAPGDWCLVRAPAKVKEVFYLAKAVRQDEWSGASVLRYGGRTHAMLGPQKFRFDKGDFQVAVQVATS